MREKTIHKIFDASVVIKLIDGVFEMIGGLLLAFVSRGALSSFVSGLTQHELVEDPHDAVANYIVNLAQNLTFRAQIFGAAYLIFHGLVKVFLMQGILRDRLWYYPVSMVFIILFMVYQIYQLSHGYSLGLVLFTALDAIVLILTWHEYKYLKSRRNKKRFEGL